jgi:hypothetical protein
MPFLKHLLEELRLLGIDPDGVRISGKEYDEILGDVEDSDSEDNPDE